MYLLLAWGVDCAQQTVSGACLGVSAIDEDAPAEAELYSAAETVGTGETEDSSVTRTHCLASKVARSCVSMPKLGSANERVQLPN